MLQHQHSDFRPSLLGTSEVLSLKQTALLRACAGSSHPVNIGCRIDQLTSENAECGVEISEHVLKIERSSIEDEHSISEAGEASMDENQCSAEIDLKTKMFAALSDSVNHCLRERREKLKKLEEAKKREQIRSIVLDPSDSDRYSRALTRAERGMYKALAAFWAIREHAPIVVAA